MLNPILSASSSIRIFKNLNFGYSIAVDQHVFDVTPSKKWADVRLLDFLGACLRAVVKF